jgi:hypothetical protein
MSLNLVVTLGLGFSLLIYLRMDKVFLQTGLEKFPLNSVYKNDMCQYRRNTKNHYLNHLPIANG